MQAMNPQPTLSPRTARLKLTLFWAALGTLGVIAVFPYQLELLSPAQTSQLSNAPVPLPVIAVLSALQTGVLLIILNWIGLLLAERVGLNSAIANALVNRTRMPAVSKPHVVLAVITGIIGGGMILALDRAFSPLMPAAKQNIDLNISFWKRALATLYGGITEELLIRLFLMTSIIWLIHAFTRNTRPSASAYWTGIIIATLLFGLGHLPATANIWPLTGVVISRALILNGLLGTLFGYLYWKAGLEYAMLAHFIADITLHVIGGS